MSKREATLMETAIAMAKHRKEHPGANLMEMMADAHARGLKSEVCGMCNVTYLACHCFVLCKENRCPMKEQGPPLLERLKYIAESPPREHGGFHPETVKTANDAIAVIKNPLSDDEKLLRYYEKKCHEQHKEIETWKAGFVASQPMIAYLRYVAGEHMDNDYMQEARDAEWDKMTKPERDMANRIVQVVFGDYL